jgi:excisionase family DNA binding protein
MPDRPAPITLADLSDRLFATAPEAAALLRLHPRTVRRQVDAGLIPGFKAGREYRIPADWLRAQASQGTTRQPAIPRGRTVVASMDASGLHVQG